MDSKRTSVSSRPSSNDKKKMEVLNPRKSKIEPVQKPKVSTKRLEKVPNTYSPSTTQSDFSSSRTILPSEKQQLELLTSDPLSFSVCSSSVSEERSKSMNFLKETLESMQARNQERENEEAYERIVDTLTTSEAAERHEKMKRLLDYTEKLRSQKDEDGNNLIEFPEDFDEIVETAVEYKKNNQNDPDINWLEVFRSKHEHEAIDEPYRKKREKIRDLDKVIKEKEKLLKDLRSSRESDRSKGSVKDSSSQDSVFITKLKSKQENKPVRPTQNFIKKNIESLEEYKGPMSLIEKLSTEDQKRLAIIEERLDIVEEYTGILPQESVSRLEEIDKALRNFIPQIKWEEKSVSSNYYSSSNSTNKSKQKVLAGDPVLREAQERREAITELQTINSKLLELQNKPFRPLDEDEIKVRCT
jgi:hypothetical protein